MTLAQRILLAISLVVVLLTGGLSLAMQREWQHAEEQQFEANFEQATARLQSQLENELTELPRILKPLCDHGQIVDDPLTSLAAGGIPRDRKYALSALSESTRKAYGFDELILFTSTGEILGAHQSALIGTKDKRLAKLPQKTTARLEVSNGTPKVVAHCIKRQGSVFIGMSAARGLESTIQNVGKAHGLTLSLKPRAEANTYERSIELKVLPGLHIYAAPQTSSLNEAIQRLNRTIYLWGAIALVVATFVGLLFARRLAKPMEQLAEQAQHVLDGEPRPIKGSGGGKELEALARAFNSAIEDLTHLRKRLAASERIAAQRDIARRVAHEIKNPLAPIRAAMETLRRLKRRDDPAFEGYFDEATKIVLSEVNRITNIVEEFTRFARMPEPTFAEVNITQLLKDVVQLHQSDSVNLELNADNLAPIHADHDQLVQVMTNLVQNAMDAVMNQTNGAVKVQATEEDGELTIKVEDNGPGINPEIQDKLFRPYVTTKSHGTGLGLAIVQRIVVEHGGSIHYSSPRNGGAEFTLQLPVSGPASRAHPPPES